jgi:hypothetical protein
MVIELQQAKDQHLNIIVGKNSLFPQTAAEHITKSKSLAKRLHLLKPLKHPKTLTNPKINLPPALLQTKAIIKILPNLQSKALLTKTEPGTNHALQQMYHFCGIVMFFLL